MAKKQKPATHLSMADLVQFNHATHEVHLAQARAEHASTEVALAQTLGTQQIRAAKDAAEDRCKTARDTQQTRIADLEAAKNKGRALAKSLGEKYAVDLMLHGIDTDTGEIVAHQEG